MTTGRFANQPWGFGITCLVTALLIVGCKKESAVDPPTQLVTPFFGISRTDSTGYIIEPDSDDWKPISTVGMHFTWIAHPNPCKPGNGFVLQWRLQVADSVVISINDTPEHVLESLLSRRLVAGNYAESVRLVGYQTAIYRVYFRIVRADSTYMTYGDVQVAN